MAVRTFVIDGYALDNPSGTSALITLKDPIIVGNMIVQQYHQEANEYTGTPMLSPPNSEIDLGDEVEWVLRRGHITINSKPI